MAKKLVCTSPGKIGWLEVPDRAPGEGEIRVRPTHGVEKHGTMAAFVKGYANERGRWDDEARVHRPEGVVWEYPVELGNMQFGLDEAGQRVMWWGPFQDCSTLRTSSLRPMERVEWRDAAMLDPGEFALGALRDGQVRIGDEVAVFGLGAIGLAVVQLAHVAGASRVFAIDPIAERRAVAVRYGAIAIDPARGDAGMDLREATAMRGVDVSIDYSGSAAALQASFRGVAYGGTITCGAFPAPYPAGLDFGGEAHMNRQKIVFSRACSDPNPDHPRWNDSRIIDSVWELIAQGKLSGEGIVDDPVPFESLAEVYPEIASRPQAHLKLSVRY